MKTFEGKQKKVIFFKKRKSSGGLEAREGARPLRKNFFYGFPNKIYKKSFNYFRHEGGKSSVSAKTSAASKPSQAYPNQPKSLSKKRRKPSEKNMDPFQNIGIRIQR